MSLWKNKNPGKMNSLDEIILLSEKNSLENAQNTKDMDLTITI